MYARLKDVSYDISKSDGDENITSVIFYPSKECLEKLHQIMVEKDYYLISEAIEFAVLGEDQ